jgi:trehalose-6-phosphate synthase
MDRALAMPLAERQERWQLAWQSIDASTPAQWGRNFLSALTRASGTSPKLLQEMPAVPPLLQAPRPIVAQGPGRTAARLN